MPLPGQVAPYVCQLRIAVWSALSPHMELLHATDLLPMQGFFFVILLVSPSLFLSLFLPLSLPPSPFLSPSLFILFFILSHFRPLDITSQKFS